MPHKQLSACFICLTICFFELYIIKKLVVSYKKPFWFENRCKFINADLFLQIFLQFYISLEIGSIFLVLVILCHNISLNRQLCRASRR